MQEGARIRHMLEDEVSAPVATLPEMEGAIGALTGIQTRMGLASVSVLLWSLHSGDAGRLCGDIGARADPVAEEAEFDWF
ncbi:hypothetical protein JF540_05390 [Salipiger thiooxidans]|uniref:hypothetical protein n=1 Tax=Salipiger thiooxidans TaxID=282683 RepID=UPI001A8EFF76|nr:hypothetical protein [Salipiger thiooxidans]MBN8186115.1 hypothetical protein [Salipiger thiooxidans]